MGKLHTALYGASAGILDRIVQQDAQHFFQMPFVTFHNHRHSRIKCKNQLQLFFKGAARHALPQQLQQAGHLKCPVFAAQQALVGA